MSRIHIMQVIECGGPGGAGNQVAALCNRLDPSRFKISLAYAVRPGSAPQDYEAAAKGAEHFYFIPEMTREIAPSSDLKAWLKLYRLFKEKRPDVVHAHSSKAGFLARTAAWAAGVPRIYYSPRGYSFLQQDRSRFSHWLYQMLETAISWIGTVIAVSESEAKLAREQSHARSVRVICDAYLGDFPPSHNAGEAITLCACGRMSYPRHPEAFVKLAQRVTDSRNGVRCLWIGGGELEPMAREMIRDMNLSNKLEVTGWLTPTEALDRLKAADLFIHYSRWEGLPNAVLEAMALGLPVVASDAPGNRDLIRNGENGYLVSTEIELLERTLELLDKPELRRTMGEKNQSFIREKHSLERLIQELSGLYSAP